ncbi:hypothetical protein TNCT_287331 [Trichonephila clavata]|uniref:Uncharacterized protein n=1 Tax=Trichonephila clavata TaxID=2740835 RepID=A0A8X6IPR8_TRICU|nr:hypothetical protein TNCT_287331 [Trichonephila clavata]
MLQPVNGPPKTFQDAMDPFTNKELPRTLIRKSPYTKAAYFLGSSARFDIRGNLSEPSCHSPFIIQQSCVFNLSWTTEDLFRITMQCFNPWTQWNWFSNSACSLYSTIQCLQPADSRYLSRKCIHPHNKTVV